MSGPGVGTKHVFTLRDVLPKLVLHRLCGARLKGRAGWLRASGLAAQSAWQPTVKACILDAMRGHCRLLLTSLGSQWAESLHWSIGGINMETQRASGPSHRVGTPTPGAFFAWCGCMAMVVSCPS